MRRVGRLSIVLFAVLGTSSGVANAATSPTVKTGTAASVTTTSASPTGTVNPNGAKTTYYFDWGTTTALGNRTKPASAGSGTKTVNVKAKLTGLTPGTHYYYQLVATNSAGTGSGTVHTFLTAGNPPPGAQTGAPSSVGRNSVTITGVIYPQNEATTWTFQYGLSSSYGLQTAPQTIAAGSSPVTVQATISGLEPGTVFHYRLLAAHGSADSQAGLDNFFETLPTRRPRPGLRVSVTPRSARRVPATFTVRGKIRRPASTPAALGCVGSARVTFRLGRRSVRSVVVPVQPDCTFASLSTFRRLPGRGPRGRIVRLGVRVHFNGNRYIASGDARPQTVTLR